MEMFDRYNGISEHINFLNTENKKIDKAIVSLETLEPCSNVNIALNALKAEIKYNTELIIKYSEQKWSESNE